ncbi:MAG: tyrosine-type recombinase/integrase [SAR324 cluster bacterium]|nr:tyrosine-type recombinase/integrase [SAR324 cluster bacterium]
MTIAHKIIRDYAKDAGIEFPVHFHMLRHSCGFSLGKAGMNLEDIQLYLGHQMIQNTVQYRKSNPENFKKFFS